MILAGDESSHILGWNVKNGWYPKGKPVTTPVSLSRKRFYSFGALREDGFDCMFYDKANSVNFVKFLSHLRRKHGKFVMYVDNAAYHKSAMVLKTLEEFGGDVVLEYFPPYTPELNPVEIQWRVIKKGTANVLYGETDDMKKSIRRMLNKKEIKTVKMVDYLTQ